MGDGSDTLLSVREELRFFIAGPTKVKASTWDHARFGGRSIGERSALATVTWKICGLMEAWQGSGGMYNLVRFTEGWRIPRRDRLT
jgi:hypothetical protein